VGWRERRGYQREMKAAIRYLEKSAAKVGVLKQKKKKT